MKKILTLLFVFALLTVGCNVKEASSFNAKMITGKVYSYNIDDGELLEHYIYVDEINENTLLEELKKVNTISNDVSVLDFKIENNRGILNLSKEILMMNIGGGTESLMLNSLSKTYIENYNLDELVIKVEDKNYESGHFYISEDNPIKK